VVGCDGCASACFLLIVLPPTADFNFATAATLFLVLGVATAALFMAAFAFLTVVVDALLAASTTFLFFLEPAAEESAAAAAALFFPVVAALDGAVTAAAAFTATLLLAVLGVAGVAFVTTAPFAPFLGVAGGVVASVEDAVLAALLGVATTADDDAADDDVAECVDELNELRRFVPLLLVQLVLVAVEQEECSEEEEFKELRRLDRCRPTADDRSKEICCLISSKSCLTLEIKPEAIL
jgi:hypothetical protein